LGQAGRRAGFVALAIGIVLMAAAAIVFWTRPAAIVGALRGYHDTMI